MVSDSRNLLENPTRHHWTARIPEQENFHGPLCLPADVSRPHMEYPLQQHTGFQAKVQAMLSRLSICLGGTSWSIDSASSLVRCLSLTRSSFEDIFGPASRDVSVAELCISQGCAESAGMPLDPSPYPPPAVKLCRMQMASGPSRISRYDLCILSNFHCRIHEKLTTTSTDATEQNIYYGTLYAYTPEVLPSAHRGTGNGIAIGFNRIMGIMSAVIAT